MFGVVLFFICDLLILGIQSQSFAQSSNPMDVFSTTTNTILPEKYWLDLKSPYPTNAWFINFVLNNGANNFSAPVNIFPYLVRISPNGINLSYSGPIFYAAPAYPTIISAFYYQFENQLGLGAVESMDDYGVASYHGLSVNLEWRNKQQQKMNAPLLQGSPYLTEFFTNATPQLTSRFKWLSVNHQMKSGPLAVANRYELVLALDDKQTQTWILYSEKPINFTWSVSSEGQKLTANQTYSGWIRLILQKDTARGVDNAPSILDAYSQTIPLDYKQNFYTTDRNLVYSFLWQTQDNKAPLMLSLPHQRTSLVPNVPVTYSGIKGLMLGVAKNQWTIELPMIPLFFLEPKDLSVEQSKSIRAALKVDANAFIQQTVPDEGPYLLGKRYARAARLILIAHQLQEYELQKKIVKRVHMLLTNKMLKKTAWSFEYDTTWGGIIPSIDNYGARHYNDHHYHYGYWVYTFAVLAQFDSKWMTTPLHESTVTPKEWIEGLIHDYANNDSQNSYFPLQRYQDDYAGHSWASGLVSFQDGQNEQSSSEAVNAYYALALYAKVIRDTSLFNWAQFLMTRELKSAQTYWQIQKYSTIYSSQFTDHNQVVADLWGSKIDSNTFFTPCKAEYRCGLQYSFGIQMLPFTGISVYLFDKKWLHNAYPTIKQLIADKYGSITPAWHWILVKGVAQLMHKNEKKYFFKQAEDSNAGDYDNGDSKTNTLYFLADE